MNKDKWGIKRVCLNCSARFYDFSKSPIVCPNCKTVFDPEYLLKKKTKTTQERGDDVDAIEIEVVDEDLVDEEVEGLEELDETDSDIPLNEEKN